MENSKRARGACSQKLQGIYVGRVSVPWSDVRSVNVVCRLFVLCICRPTWYCLYARHR